MSDNVIDFKSASVGLNQRKSAFVEIRSTERRVSAARVEPAEPFVPRVTGRQRAGRRRNPLRHPYSQIEIAVTIAGKLHRGEALRTDPYSMILSTFVGVQRPRGSWPTNWRALSIAGSSRARRTNRPSDHQSAEN
jgi:hypothetical protein